MTALLYRDVESRIAHPRRLGVDFSPRMEMHSGPSHHSAFTDALLSGLFRYGVDPQFWFSPRTTQLLQELWRGISEQLPADQVRPHDGLSAGPVRRVEGYVVRVICFPAPERIPDYFLGAVAMKPERRPFPFLKRIPARTRYLTLELGMHLPEGTPRTVLGEWTIRAHLNYGTGPEPTVENFFAAIRTILATDDRAGAMNPPEFTGPDGEP